MYTTTDYTKTLTFAKYFSKFYSFFILSLSDCLYAQKYYCWTEATLNYTKTAYRETCV